MRSWRWAVLVLAVAALGCESSASDVDSQTKTEDELRFVRFPVDLAAVAETSGSFWAVKGENRELRLRYTDSSGPGSDEFLRFEVPGDALLRRPDGTFFQEGDSVRITVQLGTDRRMLFRFEPSGLEFDPDEPARLRVSFRRLNGDLDGDGGVDEADAELERDMRIWKQEQEGEPWFPIGTIKDADEDEVRAFITNFTGFVLAA